MNCINIPLCPVVCLLESKVNGITWFSMSLVKRTILIHWKLRKLNCFNLENWLKCYLELISMEPAGMALQEQNSSLTDSWTLIRSSLNIFHAGGGVVKHVKL